MSTQFDMIDAALGKAKLQSDVAHARRYKYDHTTEFQGPCVLKNGSGTEPLVFQGHWDEATKCWDFGNNQISSTLVMRKDQYTKEFVEVRQVTFKVQETYTLVDAADVCTEVNRFRIHEVCVYNETTRSESVYEGSTSDAGNKDTGTLLRGSWHWCRWDRISENHVEVTYERMAGSSCAPVKFAVFMEPNREGYWDDVKQEFIIDATCKITSYTPVPGEGYCDKLRTFETAEQLNDWITWYESESDIHEITEFTKKTPRGNDTTGFHSYKPYHIIEYAYGEKPTDMMNKLLKVDELDKQQQLQDEWESALCDAGLSVDYND